MTFSGPPPYRRLTRSRSDRVIGGVCGGAASYLNMDPTLVRVLTVVLTLFTGAPIVAYLLALFLVPQEGQDRPPQGPPLTRTRDYGQYPYGQTPRSYGPPISREDEAVWGPGGAPWQQPEAFAPQPQPPQPPGHPPAGESR